MLTALTERLDRARTIVRRATLTPLLVRCAIFLCAVVAFVVAYPSAVVGSQLIVLLVVAAAVPAFAPRGRAATAVAALVVIGWVVDTTYVNQPVELWRVLVLATTLYLGHTLTALAAVVPTDAVVHLDVVGRWVARAFAVVLGSAVLTIVVLSVTAELAGRALLVATLAGLAAAVGLAALLSRLIHRP
ncbi:MAG TPA: hypothetical protein VFO77_00650 [Actinoplanes sp.]|nr:hypothetical protein [Actinoplanes sp.]